MNKTYLKVISMTLLFVMIQIVIFSVDINTNADTYICGNLPLNSGIVYSCGGSPLNAGGSPGYFTGGTVCSPYSGRICNICGGNYAYCPHYSGQTYGGTVCSPSGGICNVCGGSYATCPHYSGQTYGGTVCSPYSGAICNICNENYAYCPHVSGQTYGGTYVPPTPNYYHVHNAACPYYYTSHVHTSSCSPAIAHNTIQSVERWGIGEYEEQGSAVIHVNALCNVSLTIEYSKTSSGTKLYSHTILAYAENWTGGPVYDLNVLAGGIMYYNNGSTLIGSQPLGVDTTTVYVDSGWIWDSRRSENSVSYPYSTITATGSGTFEAPDGMMIPPWYLTPNTRNVDATLTF